MLDKQDLDQRVIQKVSKDICEAALNKVLEDMIRTKASYNTTYGNNTVHKLTEEEQYTLLDRLVDTIRDQIYEKAVEGKTIYNTPVEERKEIRLDHEEEKEMLDLIKKMESKIDTIMEKNYNKNRWMITEYNNDKSGYLEASIKEVKIRDKLDNSPIRNLIDNLVKKVFDKFISKDSKQEQNQEKDLAKNAKQAKSIIGAHTENLMKREEAHTSFRSK